jgi:hypothetical protein
MANRGEQLRQSEEELSRTLAATRKALRRERRTQRDADAAQAKHWEMPAPMHRAVVIMYVIADHDATAAVGYLQGVQRMRGWPLRDAEWISQIVEHTYVVYAPDELVTLTDQSAPSDPVAMQLAQKVVRDWRLETWTRNLNYDHGLAVPTETLLLRAERMRSNIQAEAGRPRALGTVADASARQWAYRWRQKRGGRIGRVRIREAVPLEDMRRKAAGFLDSPNRPHPIATRAYTGPTHIP